MRFSCRDGIVLLKPGALTRVYTFTCPDLGSASVVSINNMASVFNEAVKSLGSGWCVQFEAQRGLSPDYPGAAWSNPAGYLIGKRRQEIFGRQEAHFVNRFYLVFTKNLKNNLYTKTSRLLYRKGADEGSGSLNLAENYKEIRQFQADTEACTARLTAHIAVEPLDRDACATYLHSSVSTYFHSIAAPPHAHRPLHHGRGFGHRHNAETRRLLTYRLSPSRASPRRPTRPCWMPSMRPASSTGGHPDALVEHRGRSRGAWAMLLRSIGVALAEHGRCSRGTWAMLLRSIGVALAEHRGRSHGTSPSQYFFLKLLNMEAPVLFNQKNERVNYRVDKNLIVIDELIEKVTLRRGDEKVTIVKKRHHGKAAAE